MAELAPTFQNHASPAGDGPLRTRTHTVPQMGGDFLSVGRLGGT